ncbi:MAG TPA: hypothetical protein VJ890_24155 [Vineibacter sp.]|nr:hypothetical protein [Vineibacter sp.]
MDFATVDDKTWLELAQRRDQLRRRLVMYSGSANRVLGCLKVAANGAEKRRVPLA